MRTIEAELAERQERAAERVAELEAAHRQEAEDRDQQVESGIGFGLAALVVSAIALGWSRFRASGAVRRLSDLDRGRAIGLCVLGGLVLLLTGGAMIDGGSVVASLGTFLALLGIALPACLLMARHSVRAEGGRGAPFPGGEPPPKWVRTAIAAAMGIVFLTGLGAALSADAPEPVLVSAELRGRAAGEARGAPERRLARAEAEASKLESRASRLAGVEASGREALGPARRRLSRAEGRLASAEGAAERYSGLLDKQEEKGRREACDPNYTGCLDPNAIDYDCEGGSGDGPLYTGPVEVIESDPYDLDRDGDGHGCE